MISSLQNELDTLLLHYEDVILNSTLNQEKIDEYESEIKFLISFINYLKNQDINTYYPI